ncbi:MAG: apolipoprotein N-acyltransferase [Pseudomonadota bacterium]|nr:apolipoprotein N-acyltransferase [Pseudomonadota bacterium]
MITLKCRMSALTGWRRWLAALALGATATAALPPLHLLPLLVVAFSGLVWLIDGCARRRAAVAAGWWFGFGHFVAGLYWFGHALLTDPERFAWMVAPVIIGISALLAVFPTLAALAARLASPGVGRGLALALAWTAAEWLRGALLTGFPWNLVGTAWTESDAMIQSTAVAGTLGLGLDTVAVAALPATLITTAGPARWTPTLLGAALLAAMWGGGALRLGAADTTTVDGVLLRLVQPNVAQHHKWQPERREALFRRHLDLTASAGFEQVTHVIWPETAAPFFLANEPARRRVMASVTPAGGALITGAIRTTPEPATPRRLWNSLHAINSQGEVIATYDKAHLVPFGEYVPFRDILTIAKLTYGAVDFSAGPGPRTLRVPGLPAFSPLICYEAIFPRSVVDAADRPGFLLNITNDAWFGVSSGPYQHFAGARLRAVEQGLPLVRVANTGISAVIDGHGRVTARLGLGQGGVLDAALPRALGRPTVYAGWGDWWLLVACLAGGLALVRHAGRNQ